MVGRRRTSISLAATVREFSEASSIHGISYAFSPSLPLLDSLLWRLLTLTSFGLAIYWSISSYNDWQDNPTITTLTNPTKSITSLPFPAVTICTDGLDMAAVEQAIIRDFAKWKKDKGKTSSDKEEDKKHLREFMSETYQISETKNIFDVIKAFQSPSAEESAASTGVMDNMAACRKEQAKTRRKRSIAESITFLVQETGYKYYKVALSPGTSMTRESLASTCLGVGMQPLCNDSTTNEHTASCVPPTFTEDPLTRFSNSLCSNSDTTACPKIKDLFLSSSSCPWTIEGCREGSTSSVEDPLYAACVNPTGE